MGNRRQAVYVSRILGRLLVGIFELIEDEGGQGTVEYVLILSLTVVAASTISRKVIQALDKGIQSLGGQLEKDLKTGRADLGIWQN